ncbi:hypothetical protein [Aquimarina sp. 2201CG5-10]|uniref:hypothetical protein n=1 Tax=Aquimarina callyspongiae TaxID=3098150 RepID=UPI002AB34B5B|nr:hypothetical protein [Aquimarina sp. 2201CG5-10]MDY8137505.1 hypothetical protein [Aquimarina sp. 2201CG5-10]
MIEKIQITNIKGIGNNTSNSTFEFELRPNRPHIFVAPNGFGKSSFATTFKKLKPTKIVLEKNDFYKKNEANKPQIELTYSDGVNSSTIIANENSNQLRANFSWFVINNQIFAKAKKNRIGGTVIASASLETPPIVLSSSIPENLAFSYLVSDQRNIFGANGKVLKNLTGLYANSEFIKQLSSHYTTLQRINGPTFQNRINAFKDRVNQQNETAENILNWIEANEIDFLNATNNLSTLANFISTFDLGYTTTADNYLTAIQLSVDYNRDPNHFKNACTRKIYDLEKSKYTKVFEDFNSSWQDFKPEEKDGKLIISIPKTVHISNGQRDVMCFIALLKKAELSLEKDNCILIIDEIFDYLDDANLVAVQYYVTQLIMKMKAKGKNLYPIILTHLNPLFFKNFTFSKQKVHFIEKREAKINAHFKKILLNRSHVSIEGNLSKYHLHYQPNPINIRPEFEALNLKPTWGNSSVFDAYTEGEFDKYCNKEDEYDPFAVCCQIRKKVELYAYDKIGDPVFKQEFLDTHRTSEKLKYAESKGIVIPETYYLLGVIYNDGMHYKNNDDAIAGKLENLTIRKMVSEIN